jgi:hypothetical protein
MAKKIVSKKLNVSTAKDFVDSVKNEAAYYVFAAKHTPYANNSDTVITTPTDSVVDNTLSIYDNMIFGKRVTNADVVEMIPRYDWSSNTVYTQYDDTDSALFTKQFYATVNAGAQYHVYKCLYNNRGAASTVEPTGTDVNAYESLVDGYVWKYMYSANAVTMAKFATTTYMPVVVNTSITTAAVDGALEVINIDEAGSGYDNYLTGTFNSATDLRIGGNPYLYSIGSNASTLNDFYNGCLMYITSGAAEGEYRVITDYYISGSQRIVVLEDGFDNTIAVNDTFEIYPYVYIFDTGGQKQTNCIARALVSSASGNSISKIDIINPGSGYRSATAVLLPNPIVDVTTNAVLRPIISPAGGHGHNVNSELGANFACISIKFVENEEAITTYNDYRQVGILKDPLFANVNIKIDINNTVGSFAPNERVYQYKDIKLAGTVAVNSNTTVVGTSTFFQDALSIGDRVLITDGVSNALANIATIASNTSLTLTTNASFTGTGCTISLVNAVSYGVIADNGVGDGEIFVANVATAGLTTSLRLVGEDSNCTSVVNVAAALPISINGRNPNSFNTFTQLTRFVGTIDSGTFIPDEEITQDAAVTYAIPRARVYAAIEDGATDYLYVTNVENIFQDFASPDSDGVVVGSNSEATFTITAKYNGELVKDSGDVLYIENLSPISRSNTQSETVKLILEF